MGGESLPLEGPRSKSPKTEAIPCPAAPPQALTSGLTDQRAQSSAAAPSTGSRQLSPSRPLPLPQLPHFPGRTSQGPTAPATSLPPRPSVPSTLHLLPVVCSPARTSSPSYHLDLLKVSEGPSCKDYLPVRTRLSFSDMLRAFLVLFSFRHYAVCGH